KAIWQQYFPPKPTFTEKNVPSSCGKVFIVTGANQGIGLELVKMLYPTGATIYLAGRSRERVEQAIQEVIETQKPATPATLKFLYLDLSNLTTIKASAAAFAAQESRLDKLWNNAGIGGNPEGTTTAQNIEGHVGINCVAPLLFTQELLPQLQEAAKTAEPGSVRIIWSSSLMIETMSPPGGLQYEHLEKSKTTNSNRDYSMSKVGNWYLAVEAAQRWAKYGIVSVVQNPGNLKTNIYSHQPKLLMALLNLLLYEPKMGAYTLLYSGFT
ncbi:NAD(P)-binding protein, partial [Periconia macrospinosa]